MRFLGFVEIEPGVIARNRNHVEKALEVAITILRIEKFLKGHCSKHGESDKTIDENADILKTRGGGRESVVVGSNLELARLFNLVRPILEVGVLENGRSVRNHISTRSSSRTRLILCFQSNNLKQNMSESMGLMMPLLNALSPKGTIAQLRLLLLCVKL